MQKRQVREGQYYLVTITVGDSNNHKQFDGVHLMRILEVSGDMVLTFNLVTQCQEEWESVENLLWAGCEAISDDMAEQVWNLMLTFHHERLVSSCGSLIDSFRPGVEPVRYHAEL